jgi:hypothetical protein
MSIAVSSTMSYANPYSQTALKPKTAFKSNYMHQNTNQQNVGFSGQNANFFIKEFRGLCPAARLVAGCVTIMACFATNGFIKNKAVQEEASKAAVQVLPAQNGIKQSIQKQIKLLEQLAEQEGQRFVKCVHK